jgi:F-type H+-transporting ATPase subunit b
MDFLLNKTLNSFSTQIAEGGVSFKFDVFDSNIINLAILVSGLFYILSDALSGSLAERQQKILGAIQESEEKLQEATTRLTEVEAKLSQSQIVIETIQKDAERIATESKNTILNDGKAEIKRLALMAEDRIFRIRNQARKEILDYVVTLALQRISMRFELLMTNKDLQQQIIDRKIKGFLVLPESLLDLT